MDIGEAMQRALPVAMKRAVTALQQVPDAVTLLPRGIPGAEEADQEAAPFHDGSSEGDREENDGGDVADVGEVVPATPTEPLMTPPRRGGPAASNGTRNNAWLGQPDHRPRFQPDSRPGKRSIRRKMVFDPS